MLRGLASYRCNWQHFSCTQINSPFCICYWPRVRQSSSGDWVLNSCFSVVEGKPLHCPERGRGLRCQRRESRPSPNPHPGPCDWRSALTRKGAAPRETRSERARVSAGSPPGKECAERYRGPRAALAKALFPACSQCPPTHPLPSGVREHSPGPQAPIPGVLRPLPALPARRAVASP